MPGPKSSKFFRLSKKSVLMNISQQKDNHRSIKLKKCFTQCKSIFFQLLFWFASKVFEKSTNFLYKFNSVIGKYRKLPLISRGFLQLRIRFWGTFNQNRKRHLEVSYRSDDQNRSAFTFFQFSLKTS